MANEQVILAPNLAKKASVRNWFKKTLVPLVKQVREEKNSLLRPQWLRYYNLWALRGTEQSYHGRLRMYLPIGHRILENWVQKLRSDLFPESGKWFRNTPDSTMQEDRAVVINTLMMKMLKKQMRITSIFPGLLRNIGIFGTGLVEMGWKHDERLVPTLQKELNKETQQMEVQEILRQTVQYLGPTMRVIDPFLFYVYPYTVQHCREAELLFEDMMVGWDTLERMSKTAISPKTTPTWATRSRTGRRSRIPEKGVAPATPATSSLPSGSASRPGGSCRRARSSATTPSAP